MLIIPMLLKEMDQEARITRKMLERVPAGKFEWQPHPKSMSLRSLATHIAELPSWVTMTLTTDELDFSTSPYTPTIPSDASGLLEHFEKSLDSGRAQLAKASEEQLLEKWILRDGATVYQVATRAEIIRMAYCQIVHHRAQLGVFLRLLDIPIPGSYGPSADEPDMVG